MFMIKLVSKFTFTKETAFSLHSFVRDASFRQSDSQLRSTCPVGGE
jgi:hypothetical protein